MFSGHFHHHHHVAPSIVYCGSPMQHHFGDAGDDKRGVVIYHPNEDKLEFVQNPEWDAFRVFRIANEKELNNIDQFKNKHVSVIYEQPDISPEVVQRKILEAGACAVIKHSVAVTKVVPVSEVQPGRDIRGFNTNY